MGAKRSFREPSEIAGMRLSLATGAGGAQPGTFGARGVCHDCAQGAPPRPKKAVTRRQ